MLKLLKLIYIMKLKLYKLKSIINKILNIKIIIFSIILPFFLIQLKKMNTFLLVLLLITGLLLLFNNTIYATLALQIFIILILLFNEFR